MSEYVRRLDIAVQDPVRVGMVECARDWPQELDYILEFHRAAHSVGQRSPLDQFHDQVRNAGYLAEVECTQDVWMPQRRHGLRFELKALPEDHVLGEKLGQDFDGHVAVKRGVVCAIDGGHTALADAVQDPIRTQVGPFRQAHYFSRDLTTSFQLRGSHDLGCQGQSE